jgi:mRNA interferase MazF
LKRFDIYLADLNPTRGAEIGKVRPCVIVSPDELNDKLHTVILAPMKSNPKYYRLRVQYRFRRNQSEIMLDQIRSIDKSRLINKIGKVSADKQSEVLSKLREMFTE